MLIVITGNPIDGFEFVGPFDDHEAAMNYLASQGLPDDWWVKQLIAP